MTEHKYKCGNVKCSKIFVEPKNYESDPLLRNCPKCKKSKGEVQYLGCGKEVYGVMDAIELKSMVDGKVYTSKSKYYESLKAGDSHIIEAGEHKENAMAKLRGDFGCKQELKQAIREHLH